MTHPALHSTPRPRDVLLEQVRAVGLALRWPIVAATALVGAATLSMVAAILRGGEGVDFHPEQLMLPGIVGLLLPVFVWRGEERFGPGFLWTLPVDRRRHALARVFAGWAWLMGAVAFLVLWLLALSLLSGGSVLAEEMRLLLTTTLFPEPGSLDPQTLQPVRWTPQPLLWLTPFTSATATYLLASALALGVRHPARWIVGTVLAVFLALTVGEAVGVTWLEDESERLLRSLFLGPYGLDTVLTARTELLKVGTVLSTGEQAVVWRGMPDPGHWAAATLLWTGAGLAALWAAASRHRENRRA